MQRILKLFKQSPWLLLPLVGLVPLVVFVLTQAPPANEAPPVVFSPSPAPPATPATPIPVPTAQAAPTPTASPKAAKPQPSPVKLGPDGRPVLTPEQEAMNRRAKAAFEATRASVDSLIEMHVAIAEGVASLSIGVESETEVLDEKGKRLGRLLPGKRYSAAPNGAGITLNAQSLPTIVLIQPPIGRLLQVGDQNRSYHGRLVLVAHEGRLWGVNYVDMRRYLYSVVGSEVSPNWPTAALKAQAIAARSYALVHFFRPASKLFHLGATEYYQVYSGIEREADSIRKAVDATAGEFVSYRGGVVESLYAASDDIVMEAFQGRGMSQLGAYSLAEKGYSDRQILGHYYPGTGVARIEVDHE